MLTYEFNIQSHRFTKSRLWMSSLRPSMLFQMLFHVLTSLFIGI